MVDRLKNKVAIITGGSRGIGKGMAEIFLSEGASVVICGRDEKSLTGTCKDLKKINDNIISIQCDISVENQVKGMICETIKKFGKLDILVNNAAIGGRQKTLEELTESEWDLMFNINAKGPWLCSKHAIGEIRKNGGGSIIFISSVSAYRGQAINECYNASKAAGELLMKNMALDFAKDKIRVNSICLAWVGTEDNGLINLGRNDKINILGFKKFSEAIELHPVGRIGNSQDIAWAAVYLASDESTWVTGSSLFIDGGYTCK